MSKSYYSENLKIRIEKILEAPTRKLSELAQIAGISVETDYIGVDLSGEDLSNDNLENANFSNADLSNTIINNTNLKNVNFRQANLSGATLVNADLSLANLKGSIIDEKTKISDKWRLVWKIVNQKDVQKTIYLEKKDLSFANLDFVDLSKRHCEKAVFIGSSLQESNFSSTALEGANFENANLSKANLTRITLDESTSFKNANVFQARFGGTFGFPEKLKQDLIRRKAVFENVEILLPPPSAQNPGRNAAQSAEFYLNRDSTNTSSIETERDIN